jgi:hypothetical protein
MKVRFWFLPWIAASASAATVSFQAVADTSLFENKPDADLGATSLVAGTNQQYSRSRALFRFDLTTLPAEALITDVKIVLYCSKQPDPDQHGGPVESNFSLYRLYLAWGEGTGNSATGSTAVPGAATWNQRMYGGADWTTPGGESGTDFSSTASATTAVGGVGSYTWHAPELLPDVDFWRANPSSNFGYIMASDAETSLGSARRFGAREQPGGAVPPATLVITYQIPEPSAAIFIALGTIALSFTRRRQ